MYRHTQEHLSAFERPPGLPILLEELPDTALQRFMDAGTFNSILDSGPAFGDNHHDDIHLRNPLKLERLTHPDDIEAWDADGNFVNKLLMSKKRYIPFIPRADIQETPVTVNDIKGIVTGTFTPQHMVQGLFAYSPAYIRAIIATPEIVIPATVSLSERWVELKEVHNLPENPVSLAEHAVAGAIASDIRFILSSEFRPQLHALQNIMSYLVDCNDTSVRRPDLGLEYDQDVLKR